MPTNRIGGTSEELERFRDIALDGAEADTLKCLFLNGPTWDGDVPSKSGRDSLVRRDFAVHAFGYAWLVRRGIMLALARGLGEAKDRRDRERRAASEPEWWDDGDGAGYIDPSDAMDGVPPGEVVALTGARRISTRFYVGLPREDGASIVEDFDTEAEARAAYDLRKARIDGASDGQA